ncbi:MAG: hypothetical protein WAS73_04130 [Defluviicoccus sp.]
MVDFKRAVARQPQGEAWILSEAEAMGSRPIKTSLLQDIAAFLAKDYGPATAPAEDRKAQFERRICHVLCQVGSHRPWRHRSLVVLAASASLRPQARVRLVVVD